MFLSNLKLTYNQLVNRHDCEFFPIIEIYERRIPLYHQIGLFLGFAGLFSVIGYFLPANGFIGYDWVNFFGVSNYPVWYPPWVKLILYLISWPMLIGITFASVLLAVIKRAKYLWSAVFAIFTLPLFWTLFLGQLEGLVVFGVLGLPWLAPIALVKPQVSIFAFLARRSYIISFIIVLGISLIIWGLWPIGLFSVWRIHGGRFVNDIAIGWWGLIIAIPLLYLSRGDMDMLMLSGIFATPYLLPYNLLPLMPAIARVRPRYAIISCILTWMPLSANWLGPKGWWLSWLFVICLWGVLALRRYILPSNQT